MTDTNRVKETLLKQMADLLRRKSKNFDVGLTVGPNKIKLMKASKFISKTATSVFERELDENWKNADLAEDEEIQLPDIDVTAFQQFANLLILDEWSVDSVKSLKLSPNSLLNLFRLCQRYEITEAIENLEDAAIDVLQYFAEYEDTDDFLEISRENLETLFFLEKIPIDEVEIFDCACRWAHNQCTNKGLEPTGENYREVLGGSLFEIRFPTMSTEEFTKVCLFKKNVLKDDEQLAIFLFLGLSIDERTNYDKSQLPFKTHPRLAGKLSSTSSEIAEPQITTNPVEVEVNTSSLSGCLVLSLPSHYKLTSSPSFLCDGSQHRKSFQVNQKISLHGVGFLGPIDENTQFDVNIQISVMADCLETFDSGTFTKNIFAPKGKMFYFVLDEPIVVESSATEGSWQSCYNIIFSLKGPSNIAQYQGNNPMAESLEASGVRFHLGCDWNNENPLAELVFKKF